MILASRRAPLPGAALSATGRRIGPRRAAAVLLAGLLAATAAAPAWGQASQGEPGQGTPDQGTPGQGTPGQGTPGQGTPDQGPAAQGPATQGPATQEPAPQAPAPQGSEKPGSKSGRDGQEFQDWTLRCEPITDGKPEFCEMRQRIVDQKGNRVMLAAVGRLPNIDTPGMLILLPLGIALPPGTFLTIDQGEPQRVDVERCEKQGCRVELLLKPELLALLKAGTKAVISFHIYDHQGKRPQVDVPISLIGFSAALAEVMK